MSADTPRFPFVPANRPPRRPTQPRAAGRQVGEQALSCALPALPPDVGRFLEAYGALLDSVRPLPARHRRGLPAAVRRLSQRLTDERAEGFAPKYMSEPETLAAYLRYFLPWNLYRLARLLAGLGSLLPPPPDGAVVADLGSGPLTAVQALWLARPELRARRLTVLCLDRAQTAMRAGRELFEALAPGSPWRLELIQGGLSGRLPERAQLVLAANVLNEYPLRPGDEAGMERLAMALSKDVADDGRLLLVEPGTRAGGRLLSALREPLMEHGLYPAAPCPHLGRCPMPGVGREPWCHFAFSTVDAPAWLARLSSAAGLAKERASLSFLLATRQEPQVDAAQVRVISGPLALEDGPRDQALQRMGRYGCAQAGLVVLTGGSRTVRAAPSGCLLRPQWPEQPARDARSGGLIVPLADTPPDPLPATSAPAAVGAPRPAPRSGRPAGHAPRPSTLGSPAKPGGRTEGVRRDDERPLPARGHGPRPRQGGPAGVHADGSRPADRLADRPADRPRRQPPSSGRRPDAGNPDGRLPDGTLPFEPAAPRAGGRPGAAAPSKAPPAGPKGRTPRLAFVPKARPQEPEGQAPGAPEPDGGEPGQPRPRKPALRRGLKAKRPKGAKKA